MSENMFKLNVPFTDLNGKPQNHTVHFRLDERGVFKNLVELQFLMSWRERMGGPIRDIPTEDVVEFYNNLETIILAAYGVPSKDGLSFDRSESYKFEDTLVFNEVMKMFLSDPKMAQKMVEAIIPKSLNEWAQTADANIAAAAASKDISTDDQSELERLRSQLAALQQPSGETPSQS